MLSRRGSSNVDIEGELAEIDRLLALNQAEQQRAAAGMKAWQNVVGESERRDRAGAGVRVKAAMPDVVHHHHQPQHVVETHFMHGPPAPPPPIDPQTACPTDSSATVLTHRHYQNMLKASKKSQNLVTEQAERLSAVQERLRALEANPVRSHSSTPRVREAITSVDPPKPSREDPQQAKVLVDLTNQLSGVVREVAELKKSMTNQPPVQHVVQPAPPVHVPPPPAPAAPPAQLAPAPLPLDRDTADLSFERKQVTSELLELERDMVKQLKTLVNRVDGQQATTIPKIPIQIEHHHVHHQQPENQRAAGPMVAAPMVTPFAPPVAAPVVAPNTLSVPTHHPRVSPMPGSLTRDSVFEPGPSNSYQHNFNASNHNYTLPQSYQAASRSGSSNSLSAAANYHQMPRMERRVSTPASSYGLPVQQSVQRQQSLPDSGLHLSPPRSVHLSPFGQLPVSPRSQRAESQRQLTESQALREPQPQHRPLQLQNPDFVQQRAQVSHRPLGHVGRRSPTPKDDDNVNRIDREGMTPLLEACHAGDAGKVKELLMLGASVEIPDPDGWTPLHVAAQKGHVGCMRDLIDARACLDSRDCDGSTPLIVSALEGCVEAVRVLLVSGANQDAADDDGATALMVAAQAGHHRVIDLLLRNSANPLKEDSSGNTARLLAVSSRAPPSCLALLQKAEQLASPPRPAAPCSASHSRHFSVSPKQNLSFVF